MDSLLFGFNIAASPAKPPFLGEFDLPFFGEFIGFGLELFWSLLNKLDDAVVGAFSYYVGNLRRIPGSFDKLFASDFSYFLGLKLVFD